MRDARGQRETVIDERPDGRDDEWNGAGEPTGGDAPALEAPRGAASERLPHQQAETEGAGVYEQALEDVGVTTQVGPAHAARVVHVGERTLEILPTATQQLAAARPIDAAAVTVDRCLGLRALRPASTPAVWFHDVAAHA